MTLIRYMVAKNLKFFAGHNFLFEYIISISLITINIYYNYFGSGQRAEVIPCHSESIYPKHFLTYCPSILSAVKTTCWYSNSPNVWIYGSYADGIFFILLCKWDELDSARNPNRIISYKLTFQRKHENPNSISMTPVLKKCFNKIGKKN